MFNLLKNLQNKLARRSQAYGCHVLEAPSNLLLAFLLMCRVLAGCFFKYMIQLKLDDVISLDLTLRIASWFANTIVRS